VITPLTSRRYVPLVIVVRQGRCRHLFADGPVMH
jgi:hypothetical protein